MPISNWSRHERAAYRSYLSVLRIVDEVWIGVSLALFVTWFLAGWNEQLGTGLWLATGVLTYVFLPRFLLLNLPAHVRSRLPVGRFEGPQVPGAIRSYRELIAVWRVQHDAAVDVPPN